MGKIRVEKAKVHDLQSVMKANAKKVSKKTKLSEQKPDTFEYTAKRISQDMENMKFKAEKIEFYPEDIAKMSKMSRKEKTEYVTMLRNEKRYKVIKDTPKAD